MIRMIGKAVLVSAALALGLARASASSPEAPSAPEAIEVVRTLTQRAAPIRSYSFQVHVHFVQRTFPWTHFRLEGDGKYERPSLFSVHFRRMPWFGKGFERVSLGPLDPKNWPQQYQMEVAEQHGEETLLALHDRIKSPLSAASALVSAKTGVRRLVWEYNYGGRIQLDVHPEDVTGYGLPASEDADIVMPNYKVSAHADFSDYRVITDDSPSPAKPTGR